MFGIKKLRKEFKDIDKAVTGEISRERWRISRLTDVLLQVLPANVLKKKIKPTRGVSSEDVGKEYTVKEYLEQKI